MHARSVEARQKSFRAEWLGYGHSKKLAEKLIAQQIMVSRGGSSLEFGSINCEADTTNGLSER